MTTDPGYLPSLRTREEFVDYLEGFVPPTVDDLESGKPARQLIKTYMLETASTHHKTPELLGIFPQHIQFKQLDDTLHRVEDAEHKGKVVGLLEKLDDRHPVIYTTMKSDVSNKWVKEIVDHNPWLDRLWLSSPILFKLWERVQRTATPERFVKLGFDHESRYENISPESNENETEDIRDHDDEDSFQALIERRKAKVTITERLSVLSEKLDSLINLYDPLHSLAQLQIPAAGNGGHLLYHDGRVTNRSNSFLDHRSTIELVIKLYRTLTERVEQRLWFRAEQLSDEIYTFSGAPLTIKFNETLSDSTFERFIDLGFKRRTSRLRIGGYITQHGPTKVHITAIDRHLWQPLLLEITSKQLLGILPRGTCGNTIHRLVTNVQRNLDPNIKVWIGDKSYQSDVELSMEETNA